jgi:hypothetical protein
MGGSINILRNAQLFTTRLAVQIDARNSRLNFKI